MPARQKLRIQHAPIVLRFSRPRCRRRFEVPEDRPLAWLASVLPAPLRPTHLRLWEVIPIDWTRLSLGHARPVQIVDREGA